MNNKMSLPNRNAVILIAICCCLLSCVHHTDIVPPEIRTQSVTHAAKLVGFKEYTIQTNSFTLKAYGSSQKKQITVLTIYIEGDGLAWITSQTPSDNPTPMLATGFNLAIHHPNDSPVVYLARPCQFVSDTEWKHCQPAYWTYSRFAPDVIDAMNQAVNQLKQNYHAKKIVLIGYSGGGTIATLMTARRTDVIKLITIAGVLDTDEWVRQNDLTPLSGSLNPANEWKSLVNIPQTHWVGEQDTIVSKEIAFSFANRFPATNKPDIKVIPSFNHSCCWETYAPLKSMLASISRSGSNS